MFHKGRQLDIILFHLNHDMPLTECEELLPKGYWQMLRFGETHKIRSLDNRHFTYTANQKDVLNILNDIYTHPF